MARFVSQVGLFASARVPDALHGIDGVEGTVCLAVVADVIKNEKFRLRADEGGVADAGALEIGFDFFGDVSRITGVGFAGDRIGDIADEHQGGHLEKRIDFRRCCIRNHQHVAGVDGLPSADAGAVEAEAVFEAAFVQFTDGHAEVLPHARKIHETQIYDLYAVFLCHCQYLFWCHNCPPE